MRKCVSRAGLLAAAMFLCASQPVGAADQQTSSLGLPSFEGKRDIGAGSVNIESTMLASTAVDAAAAQIAQRVPRTGNVIVLGGTDTVDFSQVAMISREIATIRAQFEQALKWPTKPGKPPKKGQEVQEMFAIPPAIGTATSVLTGLAGLLRSDVELTGVDVTIPPRILAAAVAAKLGTRAFLPTEAVGLPANSSLITEFDGLTEQAAKARKAKEELAKVKKPSPSEQTKLALLNAALEHYDQFFKRVTTGNDKGVVPIVEAARLAKMLENHPIVLRVNTDKAGGTVLKRTNIMTFFGADGVRISGGLVASFQATKPDDGSVVAAGVVTCRTALTTLRSVQDTTWKPARPQLAEPYPPGANPIEGPTAICRTIS